VQLENEANVQFEALEAARKNLNITEAQYKAGTVSYLNVALAQTSALNAEKSWLDIQTRRWLALNNLMASGLEFSRQP
jgi:outer membrane protein TolC